MLDRSSLKFELAGKTKKEKLMYTVNMILSREVSLDTSKFILNRQTGISIDAFAYVNTFDFKPVVLPHIKLAMYTMMCTDLSDSDIAMMDIARLTSIEKIIPRFLYKMLYDYYLGNQTLTEYVFFDAINKKKITTDGVKSVRKITYRGETFSSFMRRWKGKPMYVVEYANNLQKRYAECRVLLGGFMLHESSIVLLVKDDSGTLTVFHPDKGTYDVPYWELRRVSYERMRGNELIKYVPEYISNDDFDGIISGTKRLYDVRCDIE